VKPVVAAGAPKAPRVAAANPARARALAQKGDALRASQDVAGAIQAYLAAEAADPSLAEVQKKLGLCYQLQGDPAKAAAHYRRYLATGPEDAAKVRLILETLQ
jgi:tetratricopeptide (TPR) repeat protein